MHSHTNRRIANCAYTISYKADHRPIIMIILMYIRKIWISSTISIHTMNAAPMASPLPRHRAQVRSAEAGGSAKWFAALHCYRLGYFLAISLGLCSRYIVPGTNAFREFPDPKFLWGIIRNFVTFSKKPFSDPSTKRVPLLFCYFHTPQN